MPNPVKFFPVTISSGTSSPELDLQEFTICGIFTPANLASTSIKFTCLNPVDNSYVNLRNTDNTDVIITCDSTSCYYKLDPADFAGVKKLKIVTDASETNKTFFLAVKVIE